MDTSSPNQPDLEKMRTSASPTIPTKISSHDQSTTTNNEPSPYPSHLTSLRQNGYVIIPSLLPPHLLLAAQATSKYLVTRTRTGTFWPHVRTVPKQYPPWPQYTSPNQQLNIWGIQHLLHPDLKGLRDVYAEIYFANEILNVVRQLLVDPTDTQNKSIPESELVMELFNLLVSPTQSTNFELEWHRDDIKASVSSDEESRLLTEKTPGGRQLHAQYNIALFDDASLIVVPGSHRRVRSDVERNAAAYDELPGQMVVSLQPGDAVFYDSNILHRGIYRGIDEGVELGRMTLHGSVGLRGFGEERSRQVLQHGVGAWIGREDARFGSIEDPGKKVRAEGMRRALVEMGGGRDGKEVGYSLEG